MYLSGFCQDINLFLNKISYLKNQNQTISYHFIYSSGTEGLTENIVGLGIVKPEKDDTLGYYHNIFFHTNDGGEYQSIYNGKYLVKLDHSIFEISYMNLDSFKIAYKWITGNIVESLIPYFMFDSLFYKNIINSDELENYAIGSEDIFGKKYLKLKVKFKDSDFIQNNIHFYYFDPISWIPIGYKYIFEISGTKMEQLFIVFNTIKSVEENPEIFNYQVYKSFGYKFTYPFNTPKSENLIEKKSIKKQTDTLLKTEFCFEKYKDKVLVMDFWYISCAPCLKMIPVMEKLYDEYPDVALVGMNVSDKPDKIKKFVEKRGIKYPVFPDDTGISKKYNINLFPTVLIYDKRGNLIKRFDGYFDKIYDEIKSVIEEEIKK
jgi:thiol-disulfide isomerase/thioredoxin